MKPIVHVIPNFTHADALEVRAIHHPNPEIGNHVLVVQDSGSMRLQHGMTAAQARDMAAALLISADEADQMAIDAQPRFPKVSCSQCGGEFGPGDHGFSHCENHADLARAS